MARYNRMKADELREEMRQRGLQFHGLRKAAMIQALYDNDADDVNTNDVDENNVDDNENDVDDGAKAADSDIIESEQIKALKLQLETARINLQLAQTSGAVTSKQNSSISSIDLAQVRARLPIMSPNCEILAFFSNFERALELNDVAKDVWAKL